MEERIWEIFPALTKAVTRTHEEERLYSHHNIIHALGTGDLAYQIGCDEFGEKIGLIAGAAGLCHNADRILEKQLSLGWKGDVSEKKVEDLVRSWLQKEPEIDEEFSKRVVVAVLGHDQKNNLDAPPEAICLMDADRVDNSGPVIIIRTGQHKHELPPLDPTCWDIAPEARLGQEGDKTRKTIYENLALMLRWDAEESEAPMRTRLGKKLVNDPEIGLPFIREYLDRLRLAMKRRGLDPWPFDFSPMPPT